MDYEKKYNLLVKELEERGLAVDYRPIIVKNTDKEIIDSPTETQINPRGVKKRVRQLNSTAREKRTKKERKYAEIYKQKPAKCDECGLEDKMIEIMSHQFKTKHKKRHLIESNRGNHQKPDIDREETSSIEGKDSPSLLQKIMRGSE